MGYLVAYITVAIKRFHWQTLKKKLNGRMSFQIKVNKIGMLFFKSSKVLTLILTLNHDYFFTCTMSPSHSFDKYVFYRSERRFINLFFLDTFSFKKIIRLLF